MITGFNTNVRHGGRVYHVQTEDSGRDHPHVISHLYFGGTILASEKCDYAELLEADDLVRQVRRLMEEQHRSMQERLQGGEFDPVIAERLDGGPPAVSVPGPATEAIPEPEPRAFGEGIVSEKPLDEVILDYLLQKARSRGDAAGRPGRGSRPRE